mgnify:CR=1 FL=1
MAMQNWKSFLMPYEQAVEELKVKLKSIRKEYRKRNEYSPIEFVTGRVKEVSSLLEKANKFGIPLDRVGQEMEDIAGIRIMCQFVDDIDTVIELLRARRDMQILYEKDYVRNVKQSGYRSYHIIIKYTVYMAEGPKDILAEPTKMGAPKIILVHNHPSGDPTPSTEDKKLTEQIRAGASVLGLTLADHIVIGDQQYFSFRENKLL